MRQHSLVARLGPSDTGPVQTHTPDGLTTEIRFIDGHRRLGFGLGQFTDGLAARAVVPSEAAIDLCILAACITAADTRISRADDSQDSWTREIDIHVPASDVDLWTSVGDRIGQALGFLTGDRWRLFFRSRHRDYRALAKSRRTKVRQNFSDVCLFSGGLDSFIGAIDLLAGGFNPLFVSHYWDLSTSAQLGCARRIASVYGRDRGRPVRARVGFDSNAFSHVMATEPTTRGRSFLFLAMASLAASGLDGTPTIYVPENGLISLNVPLDPLRLGAWSTHTTHPFYIARWQELLNHLGIRARLENPYRFKTKGEMLSGCRDAALVKAGLAETISCSSIAKARWQGLSPRHCGTCVPCIIRRAAIGSAFKRDPTTYTLGELREYPLDSSRPAGEHIRSFQMMGRRLTRRPEFARILVHKPGPLSDYTETDIQQYADVFRRGIEEVAKFVEGVEVRPT